MNTNLVNHVMQIADSYRNARLPESAEVLRQDLAAVLSQIQQIVALDCLGAVAQLAPRNGYDSPENIYRIKINDLVLKHYKINLEIFEAFMLENFEGWIDPEKEIPC